MVHNAFIIVRIYLVYCQTPSANVVDDELRLGAIVESGRLIERARALARATTESRGLYCERGRRRTAIVTAGYGRTSQLAEAGQGTVGVSAAKMRLRASPLP